MEWEAKRRRERLRKRKRFPEKRIVIEVLAPSWRHRVQFDVDGYAEKAQGPLKAFLGWSVESIEDVCQERGWIPTKRVVAFDV
jgi:hypothetical protein